MGSRTTVVNIRHSKYDIYIGRGRNSIFGNPMRIGEKIDGKPEPVTREESIIWYRQYFYARLEQQPEFKQAVESLRGKILGCWCKPLPCHGNVIVDYLEGEVNADNNIRVSGM